MSRRDAAMLSSFLTFLLCLVVSTARGVPQKPTFAPGDVVVHKATGEKVVIADTSWTSYDFCVVGTDGNRGYGDATEYRSWRPEDDVRRFGDLNYCYGHGGTLVGIDGTWVEWSYVRSVMHPHLVAREKGEKEKEKEEAAEQQ